MAVPEESGRREVKPFTPPSWMLKRAQDNAARLGYGPDALAKKLQEIRETQEKAQKQEDDHAASIKSDTNVMPNGSTETRQHDAPVVLATRLDEDNSRPTTQEHAAPPSLTERATQTAQTMQQSAIGQSKLQDQKNTRQTERDTRDDRRARKARVRSKVLKEGDSSASVPAETTMPTIAESSRTGAARESAVKVAEAMDAAEAMDVAEAMDIDPSPSLFVSQTGEYPTEALPKWYISITDKSFEMKKIAKNRPQALTSLEALKNCIGRAEIANSRLNSLFEELRDHVHKAEIKLQVDRYLVKKARMLNPENGLPRIFREDAKFPSDLKADSYQLYKRWLKEDFDQDILRGIVTIKGKDRNGDRIDTAYRSKPSAKYYGHGDLILGQWWPTQLCTVRDGAHGTPQGGIFGEKEKGAYSIVLSGGSGYHDKDDGDIIDYSGTDGKNFTPTEVTQHMITSATLGNVIRVIRSSQLQKGKSNYRPELGLRYDGLYKIKSYQLVEKEKEKQRYQFRLERCEGQDPIRSEGNARRPTIYEVEEFERLRSKVW